MQRIGSLAVVATLVVTAVGPALAAAERAGDMQVTVTYTGKGKVDATHELWVFLFDKPNPGPQTPAVAVETITKNGQTVTFKNVSATPAYVLVAYDENGDYDGHKAAPPIGTPIGMYTTDGKRPSPVPPGPAAKVKVSFDESRRMGK